MILNHNEAHKRGLEDLEQGAALQEIGGALYDVACEGRDAIVYFNEHGGPEVQYLDEDASYEYCPERGDILITAQVDR